MTNCKPCGRNKYWVNATNCEDCPADHITDVQNGVPDKEGCKGMNEMFIYTCSTGGILFGNNKLICPKLSR